jgi:hypothetical protein
MIGSGYQKRMDDTCVCRECLCVRYAYTVSLEPADREGATAVAIQEVRQLQRHGLTPGVQRA